MFLYLLHTSLADAPSTSESVAVGTRGTLPRAVVTIQWEGKSSVVVFANGADIAPMALLGFSLYTAKGENNGLYLPFWYSQTVNYDFGLAAGDINGDGHEDLVVASVADPTQDISTGGIRVHRWEGTELSRMPTWIAGGPSHGGFGAADVALADIDADGDLDIVTAVLWEATAPGQNCSPVSPNGFQSDSLTCFNGIPRIFINDGKGNFSQSAWQAEVPQNEPIGLGAKTLLVDDFNNDGWLDLLLGAQAPVLYLGIPKTGGFATKPSWVSLAVNPYTYDLAVLQSYKHTYVAASRTCFTPKNCDPKGSGYQIFDPNGDTQPLMTIHAGLWSGDQEITAAIGAIPLANTQIDELLGATWTSAAGTQFGGTPLLVFPPNTPKLSTITPILTENPNALPGTILPMGADILVSQLCGDANVNVVTTEIKVLGTQSIFSLPQRAQSINSVKLVSADGKDLIVKAMGNACKSTKGPRYSSDASLSWIAIGPAISDTEWKNVVITYTPLTNPDILVANSHPITNSVLWCR